MPSSPYFKYIQVYFPADQRDTADCISVHECSPDRQGYPDTCVADEGVIDCGHGPVAAHSWGPFQILDACWSPYMNPDSPFTRGQWDNRMNPNVNTWMASIIFARSGWRAWTTCHFCPPACDVTGVPIPYPRGPLSEAEIDAALGLPGGGNNIVGALGTAGPVILGLGLLLGSVAVFEKYRKGGA